MGENSRRSRLTLSNVSPSQLMLSGSALPPQSIPELGKYARTARATLKRYAPRA